MRTFVQLVIGVCLGVLLAHAIWWLILDRLVD